MRPPSSVEGVVRNADGSPAVGVTLGIDSGKERLFADTDLQGRYRFPDVPPGLVQLMDWRGPDGPTRLGEPVLVTAGSTTTLDRQR